MGRIFKLTRSGGLVSHGGISRIIHLGRCLGDYSQGSGGINQLGRHGYSVRVNWVKLFHNSAGERHQVYSESPVGSDVPD